jgi:adenylate cyclase
MFYAMAKRILHGVLIGIVASLTALTFQYTGLLDWLEGPTWSLRVRAFKDTEKKSDQIRIILLDQASLNWGAEPERQWPWPWYRTVHSAVLDFCRRGGAKSVAFDFTFTEPSRMAGDDAELASAIAKPGAFSTAVFIGRRQGRDSSWPSNTIMPSIPVQGLDAYLAGPAGHYCQVLRGEFPIPEITSVCPMFGNVFATPERNNVVTRMDPFHVFDGRFLPSLGLSAYLSANTNASLAIKGSTLLVDGHKMAGRFCDIAAK